MGNDRQRQILEKIKKGEITPEEGLKLYEMLGTGNNLSLPEAGESQGVLYYKSNWELADALKFENTVLSGDVIVFDTDDTLQNTLIAQKAHGKVILIKCAENYKKCGDCSYEINPAEKNDYVRFFDEIINEGLIPNKIVHIWSKDAFAPDENSLKNQIVKGVLSLLYITQALMEQKAKSKVSMLYFSVVDAMVNPIYAAVSGFINVLRQENEKFDYKSVIISSEDHLFQNKLDSIIQFEFSSNLSSESEIQYNNSVRYSKKFKEIDIDSLQKNNLRFRENGVYLITGGAGGLGLIFARYIASKVKCKLVITGRTGLNESKKAEIKEIEGLGSEVIYIQSDISKKTNVFKLIEKIKLEYKELHGIIHSAGVIRDSFIFKKSVEEFDAVAEAKVYGSIWLDEATKKENLDFFVMFSSIAASIGNSGQSDYAFANSFMDNYAIMCSKEERTGRILSINWPFWKEGGMRPDKDSIEAMEKLTGVIPLGKETGIQAFEKGLKSTLSNVTVFEGVIGKIRNKINEHLKITNITEESKENILIPDNEEFKRNTELYIKKILSDQIKLPVERIDSQEALEKYGIDSVLISNLNREFEKHFGQLSKTLLFEYRNIDGIADYFIQNHREKLLGKFGITEKDTANLKENIQQPAYLKRSEKAGYIKKGKRPQDTYTYFKDKDEEDSIAIIGFSGRFPMADNVDEFWENLKNGKDCITEIPSKRWDHSIFFDPDKDKKGKTYSKWGGFINDVDKFDPLFFNISPREAEMLDPQERLFLENAWKTFEHTGYTRTRLERNSVGVFVGVMYGHYQLYGAEESLKGNVMALSSSYASIANRVSYFFNLNGPSISIDTMCSSSLTAIHLACESIKRGECHMALAGGVNLNLHPNKYILLSQGKFAASDGRCKSFGEGGDGYVPGEGVGAIVLKSFKKALEDNDRIFAVIKGSSMNHGGKTNGFSVPNPNVQGNLILQAIKKSGINPRTISYIEAHGTGTSLGDPIEITGLMQAFGKYSRDKQFCSIGSAKSNLGHLESAAGIAGVIKVLMQMKYRHLVPSIHSQRLNPNIDFEESPFYVQRKLTQWRKPKINENGKERIYPRRAGISSFGAGGSNAHVILEEYENNVKSLTEKNTQQIVVLSAKNSERLKEYAKIIADGIEKYTNEKNTLVVDSEEIYQKVMKNITKVISKVLGMEESRIEPSTDMEELGFDPVVYVKITELINKEYNTNYTASFIAHYNSIKALVEYLANEQEGQILKQSHNDKENLNEPSNTENLTLEEIAYTLQIGREAMDERLAVIVESKEELVIKLREFSNGNEDISNLFRGNPSKTDNRIKVLSNDKEDLEYINTILQKRNLKKIAGLWIMGSNIEWKILHNGKNLGFVTLPGYPFARERCWYSKKSYDGTGESVYLQNGMKMLHPLVDVNESTFEVESFKKTLRVDEFFIKDHIVAGQTILPGAAHLEMVRAVGELAALKPVQAIKDVMWIRPVVVSGQKLDVHVNLYPSLDYVSFEVVSNTESKSTVHSTGKLFFNDIGVSNEFVEKFDIDGIKRRLQVKKDKQDIYNILEKVGFKYGDGFKVTQELYGSESESLARITLPDSIRNSFEEFILHPSLLDGALRAVGGIGLTGNGEIQNLRVPFAIGHLEIIKPLTEICYSYVTISQSENTNLERYNIIITDENGDVLVLISDFSARNFKENQKVINNEENLKELLYYKSVWDKSELPQERNISISQEEKATILIFGDSQELTSEMADNLNRAFQNPVQIINVISDSCSNTQISDIYSTYAVGDEGYGKLFEELSTKETGDLYIIHSKCLEESNLNFSEVKEDGSLDEKLKKELSTGFYSILNIFKEITRLIPNSKTRCIFAFNSGGNYFAPQHEMVSGIAKSITAVNHRFELLTVQFDNGCYKYDELAKKLTNELVCDETQNGTEISYVNDQRYVRNIYSVELDKVESKMSNIPLKNKGVYLIAGGIGGLGMIFARYLATKFNANIILTGRSVPDAQKREKIQELEELGAKVIYYSADISKIDDVQKLIDNVKTQFGHIDGIINSAGVTEQISIMDAEEERIHSVLVSKVHGTINLDIATKNESMDFFVFFSSIASQVGDFGVCSYASANSFLDKYAFMREKLREDGKRTGMTISINWPFWSGGGMEMPEMQGVGSVYFEYSGMHALKPELGLKAFEEALSSGMVQLIVASGDVRKINKVMKADLKNSNVQIPKNLTIQNRASKSTFAVTEKGESKKEPGLKKEQNILKSTESYLKEILSQIISLPVQRIETKESFENYGIDSVMIMELNKRLEKDFQSISKTIFFEYGNISELAKYLEQNYLERLKELFGADEQEITVEPAKKLTTERTQGYVLNTRFNMQNSRFNNKLDTAYNFSEDGIAIIGISGIYPMANNIDEYWENLKCGKDCITEIPECRWDYRSLYDADKGKGGKISSKWGGFIQDVASFDPLFFNMSPQEAELVDPQERLFLQTVWHSIEDAGYTRKSLEKFKTGVFVGVMYGQYQLFGVEQYLSGNELYPTSFYSSIANRVSYFLNFQGPSIALDTACSSSLTAIHLACDSISKGEIDVAVAGGVNVSIHPVKYLQLSMLNFFSSDGKCRSFGEGGDGYVAGEGVGSLILKSFRKAVEDGDRIYAVIKSTSINHGGRTNNYSVPSPNAQGNLILNALKKANIDARTISYVEAQATGTPLGDPIEIAGLMKAYGEYTKDKQFCSIGTVKTNIGHLESAAGVAAITKVILQMKYKKLVPSLNSENLNPNIDFKNSPFSVQHELKDWEKPVLTVNGLRREYPRRAGINSFGAGGSNAHIILEEYEKPVRYLVTTDSKKVIVLLSAKNEDSLKEYVRNIADFLSKKAMLNEISEELSLESIAYTLQVGREAMNARLAVIVSNIAELYDKLVHYCDRHENIENLFTGSIDSTIKKAELLLEEEGEELIRNIISAGKMDKLAQLWLLGVEIDWNMLYGKSVPDKVSLPGYPFAKEKYWIPQIRINPDLMFTANSSTPKKNINIYTRADGVDLEKQVQNELKYAVSKFLKLPQDKVKIDENLMTYGFNSLTGMRIVNSLQKSFNGRIPIKSFFENSTIKEIANYLVKEKLITLPENTDINLEGSQLNDMYDQRERISYPLSEGQKALWIIYRLSPDNYAYNLPFAFRIHNKIDIEAFSRAFKHMIDRHIGLRTIICEENGQPLQVIDYSMKSHIVHEDISNIQEDAVKRRIQEEVRKPFNLEKGPLMRITLLTSAENEHILILNFHHMIFDGVSLPVYLRDFEQFYLQERDGIECELSELKVTYKDYVEWQSEMLSGQEGMTLKNYWMNQVAGEIPPLELPTDKPNPIIPTYEGASVIEEIGQKLTGELNSLSISKRIPLFTIMLTAYKLLLLKYTTKEDILVGVPMMARPGEEYEDVLGYFANIVVVRSNLSGNPSFSHLLKQVNDTIIESLEHSNYPLFTLKENLGGNTGNLFEASFHFQNWVKESFREQNGNSLEHIKTAAFELEPLHDLHQSGEFNFTLEIGEYQDKIVMYFKYNPDIFEKATIERMMRHYSHILGEIVNNADRKISELSTLPHDDEQVMLTEWNDTKVNYPEKCVHEIFEEKAALYPDSIATIFENTSITFKELSIKSTQLGAYLREKGVGRGTFVGIFLERSIEMMTAILGVLKSGGTYVPLDPAYPSDRLAYMLEDTNAAIIITQSYLEDSLPVSKSKIAYLDKDFKDSVEKGETRNKKNSKPVPKAKVSLDDLAYVIYTSGSTGKPKGVQIKHRGLVNLLLSMIESPGFSKDDHIICLASMSFDMSVPEIYLPLVTGGKNEIIPVNVARDGLKLKERLEKSEATIIPATPATWQMLLAAEWDSKKAVKIWCGGEALSKELAEKLYSKGTEFWNLFGPTETTVWSTMGKVNLDKGIDIGRPIRNTQLYILDKYLRPVPVGVPGELYIGGDGLAKGYLNQPEYNKEKFIQNPFDNTKSTHLYRTGDLVRYAADGAIEYISRIDHQVKIRGFRIELGEIESVLYKLEEIQEAVVVVREDNQGNKQLAAFIINKEGFVETEKAKLVEMLKKWLPQHMIPTLFIRLKAFPMTPSRKIDRKLLSQKSISELTDKYGYGKSIKGETGNALKETKGLVGILDKNEYLKMSIQNDLLQVAASILKIDVNEMDADIHIGEYGFDSIRFVNFSVGIKQKYGFDLSPAIFFEYSTISRLTNFLLENHKDVLNEFYKEMIDEHLCKVSKGVLKEEMTQAEAHYTQNNFYKTDSYQGLVAIVGLSAKMPQSKSLDEFWRCLEESRDLVIEIPNDRWKKEQFYSSSPLDENRSISKWGSFVDNVDKFDAPFFNISRREAELMDPQQRLFLETVWGAIEDSGYKPSDLAGSNTGVFVGATGADYMDILKEQGKNVEGYTISGVAKTIISNRISFVLDLHGPSESIDTACSSSLIALHRAVTSIHNGECKMAIAGGVNLLLSPVPYIALSKNGMMSIDGRCKAFDKSANGYVRGEGVIAVMLKPLSQAEKDKDHIYAVIKSTVVNHGGHANSLSAPNPNAQADLLIDAYIKAQVDPSTISYIEAHGTGTSLGDPIEVNGLKRAFHELYKVSGKQTPENPHCGIGSIKANIGHLEGAAGLAGLLKVVLSMKYGKIPGNPLLKEVNPFIEFKRSPIYPVKDTTEWEYLKDESGNNIPRRAGVSSFGFGGANAHVVLEEYVMTKLIDCNGNSGQQLIVLSAKNDSRLREYAANIINFINKYKDYPKNMNEHISLSRIAYTLQVGREAMEERIAAVVNNIDELVDILTGYIKGTKNIRGLFRGTVKIKKSKSDIKEKPAYSEEYIDTIIKNKELDNLANLWVAGLEVDWKLLYSGQVPTRISIPTYPFMKERYWVTEEGKLFGTKLLAEKSSCLHPLVERNTSSLKEIKFTTMINKNQMGIEWQGLKKAKILPTGVQLEMARAAGSIAGEAKVTTLADVVWAKPYLIENESVELDIALYTVGNEVEYEIRAKNEDEPYCILSQGKINYVNDDNDRQPEALNIDFIKDKSNLTEEGDVFYEKLSAAGFSFMKDFKTIRELYISGSTVLSRVELHENIYEEMDKYVLHPVVMEGALMTSVRLALSNIADRNITFMPYEAKEIVIFKPLSRQSYVYIVNTQTDRFASYGILTFNIIITDKSGSVLAMISDFSVKEVFKDASVLLEMENQDVLDYLKRINNGEIDIQD